MVRTIHGRPIAITILLLGLVLVTFGGSGHTVPRQKYRPYYECRTCSTSTSSLGEDATELLDQLMIQTGIGASRLKRVVERAAALSLRQGEPDSVTDDALSQALREAGLEFVVDAGTARRLQKAATILASSSIRRPTGGLSEELPSPISDEPSPPTDEELMMEREEEEPTPDEPVDSLEIIGAVAILAFLVVQGFRWARGRG
jgi:hypothetical protein